MRKNIYNTRQFIFNCEEGPLMESVPVPANRCKCGGLGKPGEGVSRCLMTCTSCSARWLVRRCACGNVIDYRFRQYCDAGKRECDLKPYDTCLLGSKAISGTGSVEGVMFCIQEYCSCHHSRWAYHVCEHCGSFVDYRYAVMCECKECVDSHQYYRRCPVCGHCPSCHSQPEHSEIVRSPDLSSDDKVTASKVVSCRNKQQALNI